MQSWSRSVLAVAGAAGALVLAAPPAWTTLRAPARLSGLDVDGLAARIAGLALALVAGWLLLGVVAGLLAAVPGCIGRAGAAVHHRVLPAAVRRVLAGGAGLGVFLAPVAPMTALAAPHPGVPAHPTGSVSAASPPVGIPATTSAPVPPPVWPTSGGTVAPAGGGPSGSAPAPTPTAPGRTAPGRHVPIPPSVPSVPSGHARTSPRATPPAGGADRSDQPDHTTPGHTPPDHPPPGHPTPGNPGRPPSTPHPGTPVPHRPAADTVTVRPGDSLWLLAARRIGPDATAAQVAAAWPRLYARNRDVIGDDPNLVRPGQVLHLPDQPAKETSP